MRKVICDVCGKDCTDDFVRTDGTKIRAMDCCPRCAWLVESVDPDLMRVLDQMLAKKLESEEEQEEMRND